MKTSIILLTMISLISLAGCDNASEAEILSKAEALPIEDNIVLTTADLKAPEGMKFISHNKITLSADIANQGGGPAYLSVYSDYDFLKLNVSDEQDISQWKINNDSRIVASSFIGNSSKNEFAIPQHLTKLLVQIWFYDGRAPLSREVNIENNIAISW